jgi:iron(II)-dependent oxidoreductase
MMISGTAPSRRGTQAPWKARAWRELEAARARTLGMLAGLPEAELLRQHSPLMSPLIWDVAHVANYEEQWLLRAVGGRALTDSAFDALYDAFRHPRGTRAELSLLPPEDALTYAQQVRQAVREHLERLPEDSPEPLLRDGFVFGMVAQHEQQHAETLAATLQLMTTWEYRPAARERPRPGAVPQHEVLIPGGPVSLGSDGAWVYDNERPAHPVDVPPFFLDAHPVTTGDYLVFVEAGGYEEPRWWHPKGWEHLQAERLRHPLFWLPQGQHTWLRRRFGWVEPLPKDEPVQHVSWYEADAYARWAGKRLPTEAEWEKAARWIDARVYPWGNTPDPTCEQAVMNDPKGGGQGCGHKGASATHLSHDASPYGVVDLSGNLREWVWDVYQADYYRDGPATDPTGPTRIKVGPSDAPPNRVVKGGHYNDTAAWRLRSSKRDFYQPNYTHPTLGFRCARGLQ